MNKSHISLLKSVLLFIPIFFGLKVDAQNYVTEEYIYQDSIKTARYTDSISNYYANLNRCQSPTFTTSVVNYYTETVAYVEFTSEFFPTTIQIRRAESQESAGYRVEDGKVLIHDLAPNNVFKISAYNTCGVMTVIGEVSTFKTDEYIEVPSDIYRKIAEVSASGSDIKLYDLVNSLENVSVWTKTSILQDFYLKGQPLPTETEGLVPIRELFRTPAGECNCGLFLNTRSDEIAPVSSASNGSFTPFVAIDPITSFGRRGKLFRIRSTLGPAKYAEIIQESKREIAGQKISHETDIDKQSIYANLSYNLYCEKTENIPEECICDRQVGINYIYTSELYANGQAKGFLYDSNAGAIAMETVSLSTLNEKTDDIKVLDAASDAAVSNCNTDFNEQFIFQAAQVAFSAFSAFSKIKACAALTNPALIAACSIVVGLIKDKKIDKLKNDVITLAGVPIFNPAQCDHQTKILTMKGTKTITIKSGEPLQISLNTSSLLKTTGMRTWRSNARILSAYGLSGVVTGGVSAGKPYCCTRALGTYSLASVPGAPQNLLNLQSNHGSWISGNSSTWTPSITPIPDMFGKALGRDVCGKDQIATNRGVTYFRDLPRLDNFVFSKYEVYDIMGRMVAIGNTPKSILEIQYDLGSDNESGIYLVTGKNQKGFVETKKIYLFNY